MDSELRRKEQEHEQKHKNAIYLKRIYRLSLAMFISFWLIVAVGGIKLYQVSTELKAAQTELDGVMESIKDIDMEGLTDTVNTLSDLVQTIKSLLE